MLKTEKARAPAVLIVVPVYNHASTLSAVLAGLEPLGFPILVVNDGSKDEIEAALRPHPEVSVITHAQNQGKGAAIASAMHYAVEHGFAAILSFDADGQHLPQDVPRLIAACEEHPEALIIGARDFASEGSGDIPGSSRFGRSFSNFWIWVESGRWLPDTQTGLRIYPCDLELLRAIRGRRYSFEVEILTRSAWWGRKIISVPAAVYYPPRAERVSHFAPLKDNLRLSGTHSYLCFLRVLHLLSGGFWQRKKAPSRRKGNELRGAGFSAWIVAALGARFAYFLMIFPVLSSFLWRSQERRHLLRYYARIRPEWRPQQRILGAFRNFWYFAASIVDRLTPEGQNLIPAAVEGHSLIEGRFPPPGSIMVGAHYGDWFLIAKQAAALTEGVLGLVLDPRVTPAFYAALERRLGGRLRILPINQDMLGFALAVKEILDLGGRVCFLIDRAGAAEPAAGLEGQFFAAKTRVLRAPFAIASRLRVPVHFVCAVKQGYHAQAPYRIHASEIWNGEGKVSEQSLADQTLSVLEKRVRIAPHHWFNFIAFWQE